MISTTIAPIAQLIALEPMTAASLAITLAYLALDRFRYRDKIQQLAADKLSEDNAKSSKIHHTTAYGALVWLAGHNAPADCKEACRQAKVKGEPVQDGAPEGFKATCYHWFFRTTVSEYLVAFLSLASFIVLVGTVAASAELAVWYPKFLLWLVPPSFYLFVLVLGAIFPVALVGLGRMCVAWAESRVHQMSSELAKTAEEMQREVRGLEAQGLFTAQAPRNRAVF